ncbi:MAG TPA: bidirectional hydrogenase complex protein HoxE [Dissulfurispiraceae bacterium]
MSSETGTSTGHATDRRWKKVEAAMRRYGNEPSALIETLHVVQESFGYIDEDVMKYISSVLGLPPSKVYGVATFYHFFSLKPHGKHTCVVCTGTACYIKGAQGLIEAIGNAEGIQPGETTSDRSLSLLTARCLGSCGLAPAVVFDGEVEGRQTPPDVLRRIRGWKENVS